MDLDFFPSGFRDRRNRFRSADQVPLEHVLCGRWGGEHLCGRSSGNARRDDESRNRATKTRTTFLTRVCRAKRSTVDRLAEHVSKTMGEGFEMNKHRIAVLISEIEGGKVNLPIAQIKQVLHCEDQILQGLPAHTLMAHLARRLKKLKKKRK